MIAHYWGRAQRYQYLSPGGACAYGEVPVLARCPGTPVTPFLPQRFLNVYCVCLQDYSLCLCRIDNHYHVDRLRIPLALAVSIYASSSCLSLHFQVV